MSLIKPATPENLLQAARNLKNGALVGLPTETVYGLASDAENKFAVKRIYEVKERPEDHPLIVHIGAIEYLKKWTKNIPDYALTLAERFWPGPMTLVLKRSQLAHNFITGNQDSIAIRYPRNKIALSVLNNFHTLGGNGLVAPSANKFGAVSPTSARAVNEEIGNQLNIESDTILDGGDCEIGLESTIIDCLGKVPNILRYGAITENHITKILNIKNFENYKKLEIRHSGKMDKHYSPKAQIIINGKPEQGDGFLALSEIATPSGCYRIAAPENAIEFAKILYSAFRKGDAMKLKRIFIVKPKGSGIEKAINERIEKAAFKIFY